MRLIVTLLAVVALSGCGSTPTVNPDRQAYCKQYGHLYKGIPDDLNYCAGQEK